MLTIQNICRYNFLQAPRGRCGKTLLHGQNPLLSFQNENLFVFNDKQSTQYHKKKFDEWYFLDTAIMQVATSQKEVTNGLYVVFSSKTSFKSNLKLIKSI